MKNTQPDEKVWQFIHQCADIHSYRSDYAVAIYSHGRFGQTIEQAIGNISFSTQNRLESSPQICGLDRKIDSKIACPGDLKALARQAIITDENRE